MYDVIVAGGGPVGSSAAKFCAERGLKTLLLEEHAEFGRPVQCAGLLSNNAFAQCRVGEKSVLNKVSGARIISGLGNGLSFDAGVTKAYIVDRSLLDAEMGGNAANAGAEIKMKTSVTGFRPAASSNAGDFCTVTTTGIDGEESFETRIVIAADGPRSLFSRFLNLERPPVYLSGIQADIALKRDTGLVELHPYASPDFFGWVIPISENLCRVGLCGEKDVPERFKAFLWKVCQDCDAKHSDAESGHESCNSATCSSASCTPVSCTTVSCTHLVTGTIPLGIMPKTCANRVLFCGDAGGFAKPTSGGGIYTGIRTAFHAAETAAICCEKNTFRDSDLKQYEKLWNKDIGNVLKFGMTMYNLRKRISNEQIDRLCMYLGSEDIRRDIVEYGDMDKPYRIIRKLLLNPTVFKDLAGIVGSEIMWHIMRSGTRRS
ncbi:NAD(P)/FAD-dependent oxidoreductase [Methanomicrobium mobile]|uniref:NAD(P)/FAD-dependent oxidoreductase n=1 Tax=Methanomicrobium mobile TaxID=2205 RepID=UPI000694AE2B|nr:NAD(P)/FAD-dependent oxidoreductase [Methanomicrobium mobile]